MYTHADLCTHSLTAWADLFFFSLLFLNRNTTAIYIYLPDMFRVYTCVCDSIVELDALAQSIMKQKGATWQIVVEPGFPKKGIDIGETHARSFENIYIFFHMVDR